MASSKGDYRVEQLLEIIIVSAASRASHTPTTYTLCWGAKFS